MWGPGLSGFNASNFLGPMFYNSMFKARTSFPQVLHKTKHSQLLDLDFIKTSGFLFLSDLFCHMSIATGSTSNPSQHGRSLCALVWHLASTKRLSQLSQLSKSKLVKLRIRKYAGGAALLTFEQFCLLMEFLKDTQPVRSHSFLY